MVRRWPTRAANGVVDGVANEVAREEVECVHWHNDHMVCQASLSEVFCIFLRADSQNPSLVSFGLLFPFANSEYDQFGAPVRNFEP